MNRIAPALVVTSLAGAILFGVLIGGALPARAADKGPVPPESSSGADPGALRSTSALDPVLAAGSPGEVLVIGRAAVPGKPGAAAIPALDAPGALRELAGRRNVSIADFRFLTTTASARAAFPGGAWVVRYDGPESPETVAARLREDPGVLYAGPNHLLAVTAGPSGGAGPAKTAGASRDGGAVTAGPSGGAGPAAVAPAAAGEDSLLSEQYALEMVGAQTAWATSRGEGILVAVIDTGVDVTHPDLAANIHVNIAERDGVPGVDDDGNGYVDDVTGYDFTDADGLPGTGDYRERDADPADEYGHGTQVAGVIAAVEGNGIGIAGVAPDAKILPLRAGFNTGLPLVPALLQEDDAAAAILYAVDNGADILNLSWGDLVEAPLIEMVVRYAREHGVLVVAGAGNDPGDLAFYPAAYAGVVSAGACDRDGARANFSTYGQDLDLLAPGVGLWTTSPGGEYAQRGGTSFSSPMTAGVAALVWSARPGWTADQVAWRLRLSAFREAAGWTAGRGWGILDAAEAVSGGGEPPVVQVERIDIGPYPIEDRKQAASSTSLAHRIDGTAAVASLTRWTLSVLPESVAVNAGPSGADSEAPGERVLVRDARRQAAAESLGVFAAEIADQGPWVARLRAWAAGMPAIDKRLRFQVLMGQPDVQDRVLELQVPRDRGEEPGVQGGWDLVATWTSERPYRASVQYVGPLRAARRAEETSVGTHHALRLAGPLPVGDAQLYFSARGAQRETAWTVGAGFIDVPAMPALFREKTVSDWPSGTPMRRSADWDGDGWPEFFAEAAPEGGYLYGSVERYQVTSSGLEFGPPALLGSSGDVYRGIPVDFADSDGNGYGELVVFRLDGWKIYEEDAKGEVPVREIFEQGSGTPVPVAFAPTSAGTVLVAVAGGGLTVYARDAEKNWGLASNAPASDIGLQHGGVIEDMDGDGVTDAFFADAYGRLFWFTIEGATVRYAGQRPVPVPLAGAMLAVPGDGGTLDLLTTEVEPQAPDVEGDLDRAAVRVRRWAWDGIHLTQRDSLAFGGLTAAGDIRLLHWGDKVLLVRGTLLDVIGLADGGLQAGGGLSAPETLSRVDGASVAPIDIPLAGIGDLLWLGNSRAEEPGERVELLERGDAVKLGGPPLRVVEAAAAGDSLDLTLAWDDDGCADSGHLWKVYDDGSFERVTSSGRGAEDRIALDERVTYMTSSGNCAARTVEVLAAPPQTPAPAWDGPGTLVLGFAPPLGDLPEQVGLVRGSYDFMPTAMSLDRDGSRLVIAVGANVPEAIRLTGAWDANGLPIGGTRSWLAEVSGPPEPVVVPVIAIVNYAEPGSPLLEVTVSGGPWVPSCDKPFRLEPAGWDLGGDLAPTLPGATSQFYAVSLPEPLAPGTYTLSLRADCLSAEQQGPGQDLDFQVGIRVYPNPLRAGDRLTVSNLEAGSRLGLVDVSGRELRSWRVEVRGEDYEVPQVAPGLYFLRIEAPQGRLLDIRKVLILR